MVKGKNDVIVVVVGCFLLVGRPHGTMEGLGLDNPGAKQEGVRRLEVRLASMGFLILCYVGKRRDSANCADTWGLATYRRECGWMSL